MTFSIIGTIQSSAAAGVADESIEVGTVSAFSFFKPSDVHVGNVSGFGFYAPATITVSYMSALAIMVEPTPDLQVYAMGAMAFVKAEPGVHVYAQGAMAFVKQEEDAVTHISAVAFFREQ